MFFIQLLKKFFFQVRQYLPSPNILVAFLCVWPISHSSLWLDLLKLLLLHPTIVLPHFSEIPFKSNWIFTYCLINKVSSPFCFKGLGFFMHGSLLLICLLSFFNTGRIFSKVGDVASPCYLSLRIFSCRLLLLELLPLIHLEKTLWMRKLNFFSFWGWIVSVTRGSDDLIFFVDRLSILIYLQLCFLKFSGWSPMLLLKKKNQKFDG